MPGHSSLKASDSHNTLKSSIVPGGFSALSLKLEETPQALSSRHSTLGQTFTLPGHSCNTPPQPNNGSWIRRLGLPGLDASYPVV